MTGLLKLFTLSAVQLRPGGRLLLTGLDAINASDTPAAHSSVVVTVRQAIGWTIRVLTESRS